VLNKQIHLLQVLAGTGTAPRQKRPLPLAEFPALEGKLREASCLAQYVRIDLTVNADHHVVVVVLLFVPHFDIVRRLHFGVHEFRRARRVQDRAEDGLGRQAVGGGRG